MTTQTENIDDTYSTRPNGVPFNLPQSNSGYFNFSSVKNPLEKFKERLTQPNRGEITPPENSTPGSSNFPPLPPSGIDRNSNLFPPVPPSIPNYPAPSRENLSPEQNSIPIPTPRGYNNQVQFLRPTQNLPQQVRAVEPNSNEKPKETSDDFLIESAKQSLKHVGKNGAVGGAYKAAQKLEEMLSQDLKN